MSSVNVLLPRHEEDREGALICGISTSIKDLEPTKGIRTTKGSLAYKDWVPDQDELVVERIRSAGAIILGKTNTPEFGLSATTENRLGDDYRNPWNPERVSGGSSGGAAAAVAAGMHPIAQGSDGGGSIRIPSAFCGIYGIKGTQGRVPRRRIDITNWHPVNLSRKREEGHRVRICRRSGRVGAIPGVCEGCVHQIRFASYTHTCGACLPVRTAAEGH